jgi:hypothetical protein
MSHLSDFCFINIHITSEKLCLYRLENEWSTKMAKNLKRTIKEVEYKKIGSKISTFLIAISNSSKIIKHLKSSLSFQTSILKNGSDKKPPSLSCFHLSN